ncbi:MAG: hypothetical protein HYY65_11560 [Candidatus Tectomicrobia bacterium]|uniref:Uncharacterized protein n=1 Tax=Tectimicrobiota bacterium TaxID=2528274 RepID=A0A932M1B9_UNCTE|nr:hypothetical protein [Candidatus Tectomicrobia bacterium]
MRREDDVSWVAVSDGGTFSAAGSSHHPKLADMTPNFKDWSRRMAGKRKAIRTLEQEYEATKPGGSPVENAWSRLVLKGL